MSEKLQRNDIRDARKKLNGMLVFEALEKLKDTYEGRNHERLDMSLEKLYHCYNCGVTVDKRDIDKDDYACPYCGFPMESRYWDVKYNQPFRGLGGYHSEWEMVERCDELYELGHRTIVNGVELPRDYFYPMSRVRRWREADKS